MKVETKYNIGDTLWTIDNDKVSTFQVNRIYFEEDGSYMRSVGSAQLIYSTSSIKYSGIEVRNPHFEADCFPTKEELIKSL
jgi:hypothetical protein